MAYLTVAEAADLTRRSVRSVHELTRSNRIPFRRPAGTLRCLFVEDERRAWLDGAPLEVIEPGRSSGRPRRSAPPDPAAHPMPMPKEG